MIVLDASATIALLLNAPVHRAAAVRQRLAEPGQSLHVPHLHDLEVVQVLRRHVRRGELSAERAETAFEVFRAFPAMRYSHRTFLERIWALRHTLTAYDASYIALAEALDAPLLTLDERLSKASGNAARVDLV